MKGVSSRADGLLWRITVLAACLLFPPTWGLAAGRGRQPDIGSGTTGLRPSGLPQGEGAYPAPRLDPTTTPTPDAEGYLPPPAGPPLALASLEQTPVADLLLDLRRRLAIRDVAGLAARSGGERRPLLFVPWGPWSSEGVDSLDPATARTLLAGLLDGSGASPRLQGFFHLPSPSGDGSCAEVLLHRFTGSVAWPPAPTPPMGQAEAVPTETGGIGGPPPAGLGPEAAAWRFCRALAEADWTWEAWRSGPYHGLVERVSAHHPGAPYWVLRP